MKIGILTHPLDYNYGCLLQAYALQRTLKNLGHEVITINRFNASYRSFHVLLYNWLRRIFFKISQGGQIPLVWNTAETMHIKNILSSNTQKFVDRNIDNTGPVFPKDLERIDREYNFDAYVVGSDQVWLPHFSSNCFLDFVHRDKVKRIFYAASSGAKNFSDDPIVLEKCKELVESFSGISVREDSLIPVVKEHLSRNAIQVLDPTLLLDKGDYLKACIEKVEETPVIFTYILDKTEDKKNLIDKVQREMNLPIVSGTVEKDFVRGIGMDINKCIYPSVDNWILNLNRAKFVVTDSFHGTCMSIIFRKPFVVVANASRGLNRFLSLLRLFNLENRLITKSSEFLVDYYNELDDVTLTKQLEHMREKSISYLNTHLG